MTTRTLTALLAKRFMKWDVGPDRFLLGRRQWMPRTRFKPVESIEYAFRLLEAASPQEYAMGCDPKGNFWVRLRLDNATWEARDRSISAAICWALARAVGVKVEPLD
jgi:hypothetical protein